MTPMIAASGRATPPGTASPIPSNAHVASMARRGSRIHTGRTTPPPPKEGTMKPVLITLTAVTAVAAAAFGSSRLLAAPASAAAATSKQQSGLELLPPAAPAGQMTLYGHVRTLTRGGRHFEMRFDPAWFTSGLTASRAA